MEPRFGEIGQPSEKLELKLLFNMNKKITRAGDCAGFVMLKPRKDWNYGVS